MNLRIAARHFSLSEPLKEHAEKRVVPLRRFFENVIDANLVLISEKKRQTAELTFHIKGGAITAKAETEDIYAAIDLVSDKIERQLKKRHDLTHDHKGPDHATREELLHKEEEPDY